MSTFGTNESLVRKSRLLLRSDLLIVGFFVLVMVAFAVFSEFIPTREEVAIWTAQFGQSGPLVIMGIIIAETVIAPIPGGIVSIALGALYGIWPGILYAWIGNVIGSSIAFWISRRLGRPIAERLVKKEQLALYDAFLKRNQLMIWLVYILPAFPIDVISFAIGLSNVSFKKFIRVVAVGFTVNSFLLTAYGAKILDVSTGGRIAYLAVAMVAVIVAVTFPKFIMRKTPS